MKVQVAIGDPRDVSYKDGVLITSDLPNENGAYRLSTYSGVKTEVSIQKWWSHIREPLPVLVTAEGKKSFIVVHRTSPEENIRRFPYRGLRTADANDYETALLWIGFDTSVSKRRLNTNLNRLVLGIKDYMEKVSNGSVKHVLIYLTNKEDEVIEGLRQKLKEHGF